MKPLSLTILILFRFQMQNNITLIGPTIPSQKVKENPTFLKIQQNKKLVLEFKNPKLKFKESQEW